MLNCVKNWVGSISTRDTRVCFLVDILAGEGAFASTTAAEYTKEALPDGYHFRYLTGGGTRIPVTEKDFRKSQEYLEYCNQGKCSPKLMSFLGMGLHENMIIDDAIQFYAKAWGPNCHPQGWVHDELQKKNSVHLKTLSDWSGVPIDDLVYDCSNNMDSAKSLMIWNSKNRWESLPWMARDRRRIQGNVLNAVLRKFEIIEDNLFQDNESIIMPCVPCFPFLVSLKSFLWCCEEDNTPVEDIQFFKLGEKPQANILRLILPLRDSAKDFVASFRGNRKPGNTVESLTNLTYCKTYKLKGDEIYMQLFKGTDFPVVNVEIAPYRKSGHNQQLGQINLIWSVK